MTTILFLLLAAALLGAVVALLAVVVAGIRQEPRDIGLNTRAAGLVGAVVRRMLRVYVRRPDAAADDCEQRDTCFTGHTAEGDRR